MVHVTNCGVVVIVITIHCYVCVCVVKRNSTHVIGSSKFKIVVLEEVTS